MISPSKASGILWAANVALIFGITLFALSTFILHDSPTREIEAPRSLPINTKAKGLPNPLEEQRQPPPHDLVCLLGTDRIANDPTADAAYLLIVGRKVHVNAYVGEPIRDESAGREVPELAGWRLKRVTPASAIFSTPTGERVLPIQQIAASVSAEGAEEIHAITERQTADTVSALLDDAANLYQRGLNSESASKIELALELRPEGDTIYAFMMRAGEDLMASMFISRDERIRNLGYRLFELAKGGGDRRRTDAV